MTNQYSGNSNRRSNGRGQSNSGHISRRDLYSESTGSTGSSQRYSNSNTNYSRSRRTGSSSDYRNSSFRTGSAGSQRGSQRQPSRRQQMAREKQRVKRSVAVTSVLFIGMFVPLMIYTCVYSATQEQSLFENDYNSRETTLLSQNIRGNIYADDGQVLATTTTDADGNETREYPFGSLFSHVVGYTPKGGSGLEQEYDYNLIHSDLTLAEKATYDSAGEKYPSDDVYTTLNVALQQAASDALGDNKGAVVVTDIKTGKILCMVSKPDFDPETIEEDWDTITADTETGTLVNRVSQGTYAPGSTFKILDTIEFMQEDSSNPDNFTFDCPGYVTIDGETITCYHWEVHGHLDFQGAFAKSCNSAFATIGAEYLDRTSWANTLNTLGFGQEIPFELPMATSSYTLDASTSTKEVMQLAIGQGETLMTPLHLNMITMAIANGGTMYVPYLVDTVRTAQTDQNPEGRIITQNEPTVYLENAIDSSICEAIREDMRAVVEYGTATKILERSYDAAGKTGSAEYISDSSESHAWFTGFAPYEDPEVAITVIVEGAGSGGAEAVPVARDVLDVYFGYTGSDADQEVTYYTTDNTTALETIAEDGEDDTPEQTIELNLDTNGDGVYDAIDVDGDGVADAFDTDGDGVVDTQAVNGEPATTATSEDSSETASSETSDTATDAASTETSTTDTATTDASTTDTSTTDASSAATSTDTTTTTDDTLVDTDGDGVPDTPQSVLDGTATTDSSAAASSTTTTTTDQTVDATMDTDGDGIPDSEDTDANGNGVDDEVEAMEAEAAAEAAAQQQTTTTTTVDANGDGIDDVTGQAIATQ